MCDTRIIHEAPTMKISFFMKTSSFCYSNPKNPLDLICSILQAMSLT